MSIRVIHFKECNEYAPDKDVCSCAHDAVINLTNQMNILTENMVNILHALEHSKPSEELPILDSATRQRIHAQIFGDLDRVSKTMLQNWRAQTS